MAEIAYLVNQYPLPSHTFIRREIAALEALGFVVHRFSHRRGRAHLVEPLDLAEQKLTCVLLEKGFATTTYAIIAAALTRPGPFGVALFGAIRMAMNDGWRLPTHLGYLGLACLLARELRRRGISHVHAHFGTNPAAVALQCRRVSGISCSLTVHGPEEFAAPTRLSLGAKITGAQFVVTISEHGRRELARQFPEFAGKIKLIRCGLDPQWLSRAPSPVPDTAQFLSVARLDEQKNPELLIRAAALLRDRGRNFRIVVAGDGPLRRPLERLIADLGLAGNSHASVELAGWCTQQQVVQHLQDSRALVLSSRAEGLPVAVMEAFALGRPAIATDVGGTSELVQTGKTGWLVGPNDPVALGDAIEQCLAAATPDLDKLAAEGRSRVLERHDVQHSAHQLAQMFIRETPHPKAKQTPAHRGRRE